MQKFTIHKYFIPNKAVVVIYAKPNRYQYTSYRRFSHMLLSLKTNKVGTKIS